METSLRIIRDGLKDMHRGLLLLRSHSDQYDIQDAIDDVVEDLHEMENGSLKLLRDEMGIKSVL